MYDPLYNPDDSTGPRKSRFWALRRGARRTPEPWCSPLMKLGDREPIVLAEHINGARRGVDLGYESRPHDAELFVPVYAVHTGEVMFCAETTQGHSVTLRDVTGDWATFYRRLSKTFLAPTTARSRTQWVRPGDVIGYAARSPIHIRFELAKCTADQDVVTVDPKPELATWTKPTVHGPASFAADKAA